MWLCMIPMELFSPHYVRMLQRLCPAHPTLAHLLCPTHCSHVNGILPRIRVTTLRQNALYVKTTMYDIHICILLCFLCEVFEGLVDVYLESGWSVLVVSSFFLSCHDRWPTCIRLYFTQHWGAGEFVFGSPPVPAVCARVLARQLVARWQWLGFPFLPLSIQLCT